MQIIILSGGSGTRLWPLSNDARSKQFLRLLESPSGKPESMLQRVIRQIKEAGINDRITIATSAAQKDVVSSQAGENVDIVTEPCRRHTFPAICLASEYLAKIKNCSDNETIVVIPCDPFTQVGYFKTISEIASGISAGIARLILMGIKPVYPSAKYGYILPSGKTSADLRMVKTFIEKPNVEKAEKLISEGAFWNAGVFAFKLGYILEKARRFVDYPTIEDIKAHYNDYPMSSFDYAVVEKETSLAMKPYFGEWKDLGTWNTLTDEISPMTFGDVTTDDSGENTHIFNELNIPIMCVGTKDLIIAASPDGILVSEKSKSEDIKKLVPSLHQRPMYEERRWGEYWVIDHTRASDGHCSLTKRLTLNPGASISYQRHKCREEVWTFVDGEGEIVIGEDRRRIGRGETVIIPSGTLHALRAITPLTFIEVQTGSPLIEEDIERFPYEW